MSKPLIHFAHANGFPAGSYNKLFRFMQDQAHIIALDKFAHDPDFPVSNNWLLQAEELIQFIEKSAKGPVFGIGHSMGSIVTFIAACKRPDLFKQLIMLDPPLVSGRYSLPIKLFKFFGLMHKITPSSLARKRRQEWPLDADLFTMYRGKGIFRHMDLECLKDYLDASIDKTDNCYKLNYSAEIEAELFDNIPDNLDAYKLPENIPLTVMRGEFSEVTKASRISAFVKKNKAIVDEFPRGFHMFPLEQPELCAKILLDMLEEN